MRARFLIIVSCFVLLGVCATAQTARAGADTSGCSDRYREGQQYFLNEDYANAERLLLTAFACDPGKPDIEGMLAYSYLKLNNYKSAIEFATKALKRKPSDDVALQVRGWSYYSLSMYKECIQDLANRRLDTYNNYYNNFCRAASYFELGEFQNAYKDSKAGLALNARDPRLLLMAGAAAYKIGLYQEAYEQLRTSIEKWKDRPLPYYYLGLTLYQLRRYEESAFYLSRVFENKFDIKLSPHEEVEAGFYLGLSYFQVNDYKKAVPYFRQVLPADSLNLQLYHILGYSYLSIDSLQSAQQVFNTGRSKFPKEGSFDWGLATALVNAGEPEKAKVYLDLAFAKFSAVYDTTGYFQNLAEAFLKYEDSASAIRCAEKIIHYFPRSPAGYQLRIRIMIFNKGKYGNELINDLAALSRLYQKDKEMSAYYLAYKAQVEGESGLLDRALVTINQAIQQHSYAEYLILRAVVKTAKEMKRAGNGEAIAKPLQDDILRDIAVAVEKDQQKKDVYLVKASILARFGNVDDACKTLQLIPDGKLEETDGTRESICNDMKKTKLDPWIRYELSGYDTRFPNKL